MYGEKYLKHKQEQEFIKMFISGVDRLTEEVEKKHPELDIQKLLREGGWSRPLSEHVDSVLLQRSRKIKELQLLLDRKEETIVKCKEENAEILERFHQSKRETRAEAVYAEQLKLELNRVRKSAFSKLIDKFLGNKNA